MRLLIALAIVIASFSTASAQFAMDHGHAADAVKAAKAAKAAADAKAAAIAAGTPLLPSQSSNFHIGGRATIMAAPPRTAEQRKADEAAEAAWSARCKPVMVADREGIRRARYAEPDCDLTRFNTAGR
jgi:hypothetical protein